MFCCSVEAIAREPVETTCVELDDSLPDALALPTPTPRKAVVPALNDPACDSVADDPLSKSLATPVAICETVRVRSLVLASFSDSDICCSVAALDLFVQSITATFVLSP